MNWKRIFRALARDYVQELGGRPLGPEMVVVYPTPRRVYRIKFSIEEREEEEKENAIEYQCANETREEYLE